MLIPSECNYHTDPRRLLCPPRWHVFRTRWTNSPGNSFMRPSIVTRLALSAIVGGLYIAACVTPAIDNPAPATRDFGDITPYGTVPGIVALLFGSMSETIVAWSANPL